MSGYFYSMTMKAKPKSFRFKMKILELLFCCLTLRAANAISSAAPIPNKHNMDAKCGKGQYISGFLSGGCAKCPKLLQDCESQEIDDARRCYIACSK